MTWQNIAPEQKDQYNCVIHHPLQSYEWGEFREKTGIKVIRRGLFENGKLVAGFQLTIHKIPHTNSTIGYLPKGDKPSKEMLEELVKIGKENNCIYIQLEPNCLKNQESRIMNQANHNSLFIIHNSFRPLFTKYTFLLDLTKSEDELLKDMHPKTRYNIKVAQKHGVQIVEDNSEEAFAKYWQIMQETTNRQKFYAHNKKYHQLQRESFGIENKKNHKSLFINHYSNELSAHLFLANYKNQTLAAWTLFVFHDTLYYPYGSSSSLHRETMASNLMMWEAIKFGKKLGLKKFDMWGALSETPDQKDPWYGFHRFKQGYSPQLIEFVGSYDLVLNQPIYQCLKIADKLRWLYLRILKS